MSTSAARIVRAYLYGRPDTVKEFDLEDGDCPACVYVHRYCRCDEDGVAFVVFGDEVRRVEVLAGCGLYPGGPALVCVEVTAEEVNAELAEHACENTTS